MPDLQHKVHTLPRLILRKLPGHLIEFGTVLQFRHGFFLFGMFLALEIGRPSSLTVLSIEESIEEVKNKGG